MANQKDNSSKRSFIKIEDDDDSSTVSQPANPTNSVDNVAKRVKREDDQASTAESKEAKTVPVKPAVHVTLTFIGRRKYIVSADGISFADSNDTPTVKKVGERSFEIGVNDGGSSTSVINGRQVTVTNCRNVASTIGNQFVSSGSGDFEEMASVSGFTVTKHTNGSVSINNKPYKKVRLNGGEVFLPEVPEMAQFFKVSEEQKKAEAKQVPKGPFALPAGAQIACLMMRGNGGVTILSGVKIFDNFVVMLSGATSLTGAAGVECSNLNATLSGTGNINLPWTTKVLNATVSGVGNVEGIHFTSMGMLTVSGIGNVDVTRSKDATFVPTKSGMGKIRCVAI